MTNQLLAQDLTYQIIGILYEIHNKLGNVYQEKHYQRAIAQLLSRENIPFTRETPVNITLDDQKIGQYKLDFVINNKVILETKTTDVLLKKHQIQILSYMNQLQIRIGLLVNFRQPKLQIKRLILPDKYIRQSA